MSKSEQETKFQMATVREIRACPIFSGKKEEYEKWRVRANDWLTVYSKGEYIGMEMRMSLDGEAFEVVKDMTQEELKGVAGSREVLRRLDKYFKKDLLMEKYGKVKKFMDLERGKAESVTDFLNRYERVAAEWKKATAEETLEEMLGCHLLERAGLSGTQKQMVLAACGEEAETHTKIRAVMKRMFVEWDEEQKVEEEVWHAGERREIYHQKMNPSRNGRVTKCVICASLYHWARECPKNFKNRKERKERRRTSTE